jgi:hypothetical protein
MKVIHVIEIRNAIRKWAKTHSQTYKEKAPCIVCVATRFNWDVFHMAQVRGNSISFLAELYTYLTADQITKELMRITGIDGREVSHGIV